MAASDAEGVAYRELARDPFLLTVTLLSFTATLGTFVVSPAFPSMVGSVAGTTDGNVGLVISVYALSGLVLTPVYAVLIDLVGRRTILVPSLLLFGASGAAIAFVDTFEAVLALRVVQGVGGGALMPLAITLVGDHYTGPTASSAQGIRLSANGVSAIVTPAVAGLLAGVLWAYPYLIFLLAFPTALLAYWYVPETIEQPEDPSIANHLGAIRAEIASYAGALRHEVTDVDLAVMLFGGFFQGFSYYAIITFVPLFAVDSLGASAFLGGAVLSARGVTRIFVAPVSGSWLQYVTRKTGLVVPLALAGLATAVVGLAPSVPVLALAIGVFGLGDAFFTPVHRDTFTRLASQRRRAGIVNTHSLLRKAATLASPAFFGGLLVVSDFRTVFLVAAAVLLVYGVLILALYSDPDL